MYCDRLFTGMIWKNVQSTCVFETDFGLSINCGLKKSGMFRVRNLGGLKGYVGLGKRSSTSISFNHFYNIVKLFAFNCFYFNFFFSHSHYTKN